MAASKSKTSRIKVPKPVVRLHAPKIKAPKIQAPKLSRPARNGKPAKNGAAPENRELIAERDRLLEKFTVMQADLGGAFYEMAIRDHVRLDVLTRKAGELQRVDAELLAVERLLEIERTDAAGHCPICNSPFGAADRFCPQCGTPLVATEARA